MNHRARIEAIEGLEVSTLQSIHPGRSEQHQDTTVQMRLNALPTRNPARGCAGNGQSLRFHQTEVDSGTR